MDTLGIRTILYAAALLPVLAIADVTLDGTTGGTNGDSVGAGSGYTYDITEDLGTRSGENLFHSFIVFDVDEGEHANFSGDAAIANVVGRITGGFESNVAGRVSSSIESAFARSFPSATWRSAVLPVIFREMCPRTNSPRPRSS